MAERIPLTARLARALLAFSGADPGRPEAPAPTALALKATPGLEALPLGGYTGGIRFPTRVPSADAMLRWFAENPWAHNRLLVLGTSVADAAYRVGMQGRNRGDFNELPAAYPFWSLIDEPNPWLDGWDFRFLTDVLRRATGEVYWRVLRGTMRGPNGDGRRVPIGLMVVPSHWVQVLREFGTARVTGYRVNMVAGVSQAEDVPVADMVWLRSPDPRDPYVRGLGDVLSAATEIETFEYASESDRRFMLNDAQNRVALELPPDARPDAQERKEIRDDFAQNYGGPWNAGSIPILWGGAKLATIQATRKELDFVESQRFLRDAIVAPLHKVMVGITEDVNRAQAEAAEYVTAKYHVRPAANRMARAYTKVARMMDDRAVVVVDDPVPEDATLRANMAAVVGTIATVDERRAMIHLPELPNGAGKVRQLPLAVIEVPEDGEAPEPEPEPAPAGGDGEQPGEEEPATGDGEPAERSALPGVVAKAKVPTFTEILRALPPADRLHEASVKRLLAAYTSTLEGRWGAAAGELGLDLPGFDVNNPEVARFLREEAGQRIRGIDQTTLTKVRDTLAEGAQAGEGIPDLARRVSAVFEDAKGPRAQTIARTETLYASNRAAFIAYGESRAVPKLEWLLAPDYFPEIDGGECEPLDGRVVEYGQEFAPGVPFPPLHPNCRCTIAPVFEAGGAERAEPEETPEAKAEQRALDASERLNQTFAELHGDFRRSDVAYSEHMARVEAALREAGLSPDDVRWFEDLHAAWVRGDPSSEITTVKEQMAAYARAAKGGEGAPTLVARAERFQRWQEERLRKLAKNGEVTVYRGLSSRSEFAQSMKRAFAEGNGEAVLNFGKWDPWSVSSWTTDPRVASSWSADTGVLMQAQVKIEDVIASGITSPKWGHGRYLTERELVVQVRRLRVRDVLKDFWADKIPIPKKQPADVGAPVVDVPASETTWHRQGRKPVGPGRAPKRRGERRLYDEPAHRKAHVDRLGLQHARQERQFRNALLRALQDQQRLVVRAVRGLA